VLVNAAILRKAGTLGYASRVVFFSSLVWIGFVAFGCSPGPQTMSRNSFDVFSGFTFVASSTYNPEASPTAVEVETLPKHGIAELPPPVRPQVGIKYVFHHRRPVDNEKLAVVDLPTRLRSVGIKPVNAPKSGNELMYLFIGGPAFKISIREGDHEGVIYNQTDWDLLKSSSDEGWAAEDYVLL
jgi:hypothetical protein